MLPRSPTKCFLLSCYGVKTDRAWPALPSWELDWIDKRHRSSLYVICHPCEGPEHMDYGSDIQGDQRVGKSREGSPPRRGCCSRARLPLFSIDKPEQARRGGHGQRRVVFSGGLLPRIPRLVHQLHRACLRSWLRAACGRALLFCAY